MGLVSRLQTLHWTDIACGKFVNFCGKRNVPGGLQTQHFFRFDIISVHIAILKKIKLYTQC